jgi:nucleoside recognition membrane protein YjiH
VVAIDTAGKFTAAQAAQKIFEDLGLRIYPFTAAQAAQKIETSFDALSIVLFLPKIPTKFSGRHETLW